MMAKSKNKKLTSIGRSQTNALEVLTGKNELPFILCFRDCLENGYTFKDLKPDDLRQFHSFLNKIAKQTITQVESSCKCENDKNDKAFDDDQIQMVHFRAGARLRIHGYYEGGLFIVRRLDPQHKYHRS